MKAVLSIMLLVGALTGVSATKSGREWKKPAHPTAKVQNAVIAAFFKHDTCAGPVTVVNTAERACQPLPTSTYDSWWTANAMQKLAWHDERSSADTEDSSTEDSSSKKAGVYPDLNFSHMNATKSAGYFTVLCNHRSSADFEWHQGYDDDESSRLTTDGSSSSSSSSSPSSSAQSGSYRRERGYWSARPVGGRVLICRDSGCRKCSEAVWFHPLQCLAQSHYGWDYLCAGNKKHHTCGFAAVQAVCTAKPEEHRAPGKKEKAAVEEVEGDDSSSASTSASTSSSEAAA